MPGSGTSRSSPVLLERLTQMVEFHKPDDYLFATKKGTPLQLNNVLNRQLHPLLKQLGIPRGGFHDFRHANASLMASVNAPAPVKKGRLGHTSLLVTGKYEHVSSADDIRVSTEIDNLLTSGNGGRKQ